MNKRLKKMMIKSGLYDYFKMDEYSSWKERDMIETFGKMVAKYCAKKIAIDRHMSTPQTIVALSGTTLYVESRFTPLMSVSWNAACNSISSTIEKKFSVNSINGDDGDDDV